MKPGGRRKQDEEISREVKDNSLEHMPEPKKTDSVKLVILAFTHLSVVEKDGKEDDILTRTLPTDQ